MERAIVLLSGGVDSAVALWWAKKQGWDIRPLTFDYFGRPKRENEAVRALTSQAETAPIRRVDLPFLKEVDDLRKEGFENRILLDSPEGYIPGRNLIFYGLAGYYAELDAARYLVGGHNGVDPESFPDSSPKFFNFLNSMFHLSLWSYDKAPVQILVPLSGKSKEEVVRMGLEMNVPFTSPGRATGTAPCIAAPASRVASVGRRSRKSASRTQSRTRLSRTAAIGPKGCRGGICPSIRLRLRKKVNGPREFPRCPACIRPTSGRSPRSDSWRKAVTT